MSVISKLIGGGASQPIEALGNVIDQVFTSDDERLQAEAVLQKIAMQPQVLQAEINKIEAGHRSLFVAGWRPFLGWVSGVALFFPFVINPLLQWATGKPGPQLPMESLMELVIAMLGLGAYRTIEKVKGRAK
ncbi:3TM-type holin [Spongiibacter sp. UBA1325]|uniref:3TM-type holin n=1 Tax=Spongiibacter sp. UBA1325 TaxID=1947543 RepID=UPI00257C98AD|nr:3TM-type holin [Spongiibacter sp. UBA1325]|tara:strand:+ start:557 stop:952 length:396 start_codon:yes stop_codon:yes gene_type:complete